MWVVVRNLLGTSFCGSSAKARAKAQASIARGRARLVCAALDTAKLQIAAGAGELRFVYRIGTEQLLLSSGSFHALPLCDFPAGVVEVHFAYHPCAE